MRARPKMEQAMNNMPGLENLAGMTEKHLTTALSIWAPFLEGLSNLCRQQTRFLECFEAATVEVLERQRAGCTAMQELIERLGAARNSSDVLAAQQEWLGTAMQRLMADTAAYPSTALGWMNEVGLQWQARQHQPARAVAKPAKSAV